MLKLFIYGAGFFLSACWAVISTICDKQVQDKIIFVKSNDEFKKWIHPSQLEEIYGGYCKNVCESGDLFPPKIPSDQYLLECENKSDVIMSKDDYIKKVNNDDRIVRSPYVFINEEQIKKSMSSEKSKEITIKKNDIEHIRLAHSLLPTHTIMDRLIVEDKVSDTKHNIPTQHRKSIICIYMT